MYSFYSFTMGHFVTWWPFVWRKNFWSFMTNKRNSLQSLFIERWVCACFYTSSIVVLLRSRSNRFRLVLPIPKAWVFNVLLISSHWLLHMTAKLKIIRLYMCIVKLDSKLFVTFTFTKNFKNIVTHICHPNIYSWVLSNSCEIPLITKFLCSL